jgi:hypothetical protein
MVRELKLVAPTKEKSGGWVHLVGAPAGLCHVMANLAGRGTTAEPEKIVAQSLAEAMEILATPLMTPRTLLPAGGVAEVPQGNVVLPKWALTLTVSWVATPPARRGGENFTMPDQTPPEALQVTVPGKTGMAWATPTSTVKSRSSGKTAATVANAILRPIFDPPFSHQPPVRIIDDREQS